MNISSDTISILKNFSDINENILFKPGSKISTVSGMKNILAEAEVSEKFFNTDNVSLDRFIFHSFS